MMHAPVTKLLAGEALAAADTRTAFDAVIRGDFSDIELTALLVGLKLRGETPSEIAGAVAALRDGAREFPRPAYRFGDIVGTGGDGGGTINISTAAALVAAEAGLPVAKHGNRAISSRCGAADLLEQFGVRLDMSPDTARRCLDEVGITFLFAPHYHSGIRHVMPVRQRLATRTVFNLLGPLVNPASTRRRSASRRPRRWACSVASGHSWSTGWGSTRSRCTARPRRPSCSTAK